MLKAEYILHLASTGAAQKEARAAPAKEKAVYVQAGAGQMNTPGRAHGNLYDGHGATPTATSPGA